MRPAPHSSSSFIDDLTPDRGVARFRGVPAAEFRVLNELRSTDPDKFGMAGSSVSLAALAPLRSATAGAPLATEWDAPPISPRFELPTSSRLDGALASSAELGLGGIDAGSRSLPPAFDRARSGAFDIRALDGRPSSLARLDFTIIGAGSAPRAPTAGGWDGMGDYGADRASLVPAAYLAALPDWTRAAAEAMTGPALGDRDGSSLDAPDGDGMRAAGGSDSEGIARLDDKLDQMMEFLRGLAVLISEQGARPLELDDRAIGEAAIRHMSHECDGPLTGPASFDPRRSMLPPGAAFG